MQYPFPSQDVLEAAAVAVLEILRNHKHIYNHSLRYQPQRAQLEAARRMARAALMTVWQHSDDPIESLARQVAERAGQLVRASERQKHNGWRRPEYGQIETYARLKRKYAPK